MEKKFVPLCAVKGPDMPDGRSTLCMLLEDHEGPHEYSTFEMMNGYVAMVPATKKDP